MYRLLFTDKSDLLVDDETGEAISDELDLPKNQRAEYITSGKDKIKTSMIMKCMNIAEEEHSNSWKEVAKEYYLKRNQFLALTPQEKAEYSVGYLKLFLSGLTGQITPTETILQRGKDVMKQWFIENPRKMIVPMKLLFEEFKDTMNGFTKDNHGNMTFQTQLRKSILKICESAQIQDNSAYLNEEIWNKNRANRL